MLTNQVDLNVSPGGIPPVIHVSQYDAGTPRLELHLVCKGEELILRTRDDCRQFDPWAIAGQADDEEMSEEISETTGIRMIREMATEVNYTSAMKLNNLTIRV